MRRTRTTLCLLAGSALLAGCGGGTTTPKAAGSSAPTSTPSLSPVAKIQAAGDVSAKAGSSKIALVTTSSVGGKDVTITVDGAFDRAKRLGQLTLQSGAAGAQTSFEERFIGDDLYLTVPQQPGAFYKLSLKDLVGTSLAASADPTAGFQALKAASSDVTAVGSERVRDADTTHYKGTFDVQAAAAKIGGAAGQALASSLQSSGLKAVPFDAYLDDQGRVRKVVEAFTATVQGQQVRTSSTVEAYDYGTTVTVTAPPPAQVKDGAPLLAALKGGG